MNISANLPFIFSITGIRMIYPSRPTCFHSIASHCLSIANRFGISRDACKAISDAANIGIPIMGATFTGVIGAHLWNHNQRILAGCAITFLLLSTSLVWASAIVVHKIMFQAHRILPPPATLLNVVEPPA